MTHRPKRQITIGKSKYENGQQQLQQQKEEGKLSPFAKRILIVDEKHYENNIRH